MENQKQGQQGRQPEGEGLGPDGICLCPECGEEKIHQRGIPCYQEKCPVCGAKMIRKS